MLLKLFSFQLMFALSVFTRAATGYFYHRWSRCIYSSSDYSDMVYMNGFYFNKHVITQFNSTLGRFEGFTESGIKNAEIWNNNSYYVEQEKAAVDRFCKYNAKNYDTAIRDKTTCIQPKVKLNSVRRAGGRHPAVLMCSAYHFYPDRIKVYWLRDGKPVTSDVTSTDEMPNGDWYYQIHSELEFTPKSGEKISCVVEHASLHKPMIVDWDPSTPVSERNKIVTGASGLVLGIIIAAAGLIYYKKKSAAGRILVPH